MIKKEYTKDGLTVIWQPDLCIHSAVCFHQLPGVFRPRERPWVRMEAGDRDAILATVHACPSGALSIKEETQAAPPMEKSKVKVFENGPLRVMGPTEITLPDGTVVEKPNGVSFCRCGRSGNLPFCDSSHKTNGFVG